MNRIKQREHIFKIIFSLEFGTRQDFHDDVACYLEDIQSNDEVSINYIRTKVLDMAEKLETIDEHIDGASTNWNVQRMAKVELAILRLASYEILFDKDVPDSVAVNEAVELAKKYGGDTAPSFVNGVLGNIIKQNVKQ